ncbi:hypothetical protein ACG5V6_24185 [Streptomyces chitinivorans]|uniref:Lipoprotein n=1 Tax=Streptomyces chitinivorans TaxID=1257027 RepID=A0ABW7HZF6_9ACTN|nr:hypothetical protein [Streptomyces chitinivorans]MDH2408014.1 hypothetical protein [Streptomyces chitinivorans]
MPLRRRTRTAALALPLCAALLAACTGGQDQERPGARSGTPSAPASAGPTAVSTAAPAGAKALAERYRESGGDEDVYAVQREVGPGGVPLLTVRSRATDSDAQRFDRLKESLVLFLVQVEGVSLERGYLMDVFGRDGSLLHRLDARP